MTDRRADAIGTGVAAADDEDALGADRIGLRLAGKEPVLSAEEFESEVNACEFASGNLQVACGRSADRDDDCVVRALQVVGGNVDSHFGIVPEHYAF